MKYAMILPDGAADDPLPQLDGRTPLEVAKTPNMDWIARNGRLARAVTIPPGFTPATDVGTLSVFGYDSNQCYTGRAPIEAAARGLDAGPGEIIFRCNLVTILDGRMSDYTGGHVTQDEADRLMADLNLFFASEGLTFHPSVSYRNLMIMGDAGEIDLKSAPPHDIPNRLVSELLPTGTGQQRVRDIMDRARSLLADHDVNRARREQNRPPVTDIWLWGQGRPITLEPFADRFGPRGAVITGVDIIRGLAVCMGMKLIEVPGATGYIDTNYRGKGQAGAAALNDFDLVAVHVEAPDEAGHLGDVDAKITALERIDELVAGPILEAVRRFDNWRILVAPDHPTPCTTMAHDGTPPPVCYAGTGVDPVEQRPFTEKEAQAGGWLIDPGHELMNQFLAQ